MPQLPKWVWYIIWIAIVLIVFVVLKVSIHAGPEGIGVSQGLVH
jgi:hypothetical protein